MKSIIAIFTIFFIHSAKAEIADDFLILEASGEISAFKNVRDTVIAQVYAKRIGAESFQFRQCTYINGTFTGCNLLENGYAITQKEFSHIAVSIPRDTVRLFTDAYMKASGEARGFLRSKGPALASALHTIIDGSQPIAIKAEHVYDADKLFPYILWRIRY